MRVRLRNLLLIIIATVFPMALLLGRGPADPLARGRPASQWTAALLSPDYALRQEAQEALLEMGSNGVPQICLLLRSGPPMWRRWVEPFSAQFPSFRLGVDNSGTARQRGAEMISLLGAAGASAGGDLVDALAWEDAAKEAERALLRIGRTAVPDLVKGLRSGDAPVRRASAALLKNFPEDTPTSVNPLLRACTDADPLVRKQAALSLGELHAFAARETILRLCMDANPETRAAALEALGNLGAASVPVLDEFRRSAQDAFPVVRLAGAKALWRLTGDAAAVVPVLAGILPTPEGWQAAYTLGEIGPAAAPAVPALLEMLKREKVPRAFRTPPASALALGKIQEPAVPGLVAALSEPAPQVRLAAVLALGFMGSHARPAIDALAKMLHDPEAEVRHVTAITLAGIGAESSLTIAGLSDCLHAEDIYLRSAAAACLREIAPDQKWSVPAE